MKKLTDPQARLAKKLPVEFQLVEDFRKSNCPPTIVQTLDGREVYRFTTGDARAFYGLYSAGALEFIGGQTEGGKFGGLVTRLYVKAA